MDKTNRNEGSFLSHFFAIGAGTIINMFLGLITTPIITRMVDPNEYGQLGIFTMYTSIATMFLCIGLDQALVRYYYDDDSVDYHRSLLKFCLTVPVIIASIVSIIVIALSLSRAVIFEFSPVIMMMLCVNVLASIWNRLSVLVLRTTYQSKRFAVSNVLHRVSYIVIAIALLLLIRENKLESLIIATVLSLVFQAAYATSMTKELWRLNAKTTNINTKEIIRYGIPLMLSMGLTTLFQAIDKMSLNYFCTYSEVGVYTSAMTLVNIFAIIQTTFNALWGPMQVEHYVNNPEDTTFIRKGNRYITIVMFFIGLTLILFKDIFALLLGEKYRLAAYILPFLIFNPIMYTISETTCSGIGLYKKSHLYIYISLGPCITNLIGNWLLVPRFGCQGAAISTGISYIVYFALRTYFSNKYYYIDYALKRFAIITIATLIYAWINTFYAFGIASIIGYIICSSLLFLLYRNETIEAIRITTKQLTQLLHRQ